MKKWLMDNFLPMWAKQTVLLENRQLAAENEQLRQENEVLRSYIRGLHRGMRKTGGKA